MSFRLGISFASRSRLKTALRLAMAVAAMGIATPSLVVAADACVDAELRDINFGLAFVMTRQEQPHRTHGHPFSDFVASNVTIAGDRMDILGVITGTNEIGMRNVTITLQNIASGNPSIRIDLAGFLQPDINTGDTWLSGGIFASYDKNDDARSGEFARVSASEDLSKAHGEIHDYGTTVMGTPGTTEWLFSGQWFLDCHSSRHRRDD